MTNDWALLISSATGVPVSVVESVPLPPSWDRPTTLAFRADLWAEWACLFDFLDFLECFSLVTQSLLLSLGLSKTSPSFLFRDLMISGTLLAWINTRFESVSFLEVLFGLLDKFDGFVPHLLWFLASFANFTCDCWLHERSASDCNRWLTRLWWAIIFLPRRSCGCRWLTTSRMVVSPLVFLIILLILVSI